MKALARLLVLSVVATGGFAHAQTTRTNTRRPEGVGLRPDGKGRGVVDGARETVAAGATAATGSNGIAYHGGPLMTAGGGVNVYYIWYGDWSYTNASTSAVAILDTLAQNLGGSPYFNINTGYYDGSGARPANKVTFVKQIGDMYSHGKSLADADVESVVALAIKGGKLPYDLNGVYFVLGAHDVQETSGFCTQYCGWHSAGTINGGQIKYAFIGDPARCPSGCEAQTTGPNGNAAADAMASIIAHELEESVTDPLGTAWYDSAGEENADKCAWTFGTTQNASNGSQYNMTLGGRHYLIQQNWVNANGGYCALK